MVGRGANASGARAGSLIGRCPSAVNTSDMWISGGANVNLAHGETQTKRDVNRFRERGRSADTDGVDGHLERTSSPSCDLTRKFLVGLKWRLREFVQRRMGMAGWS